MLEKGYNYCDDLLEGEYALNYVIGAVCGLAIGCAIGVLKNIFIWRGYTKEKDDGSGYANASQIYARALISYTVNILALIIVFLIRNVLPFSWVACIIALATGMAIMNIVTAARRKAEN